MKHLFSGICVMFWKPHEVVFIKYVCAVHFSHKVSNPNSTLHENFSEISDNFIIETAIRYLSANLETFWREWCKEIYIFAQSAECLKISDYALGLEAF